MPQFIDDLKTISRLIWRPAAPVSSGTSGTSGTSDLQDDEHARRMEQFYAEQAQGYDSFRKRLLKGRESLIANLQAPANGVLVDLGGGTGANLEFATPEFRDSLAAWHIVDLSESLLRVAAQRVADQGWHNVHTAQADACTWLPPEGAADVVLFSYSLTMIPDWVGVLEHAWDMLRPGGHVAVVDFYVSRKYPAPEHVQHGAFTRHFWPTWFSWDDVFLNPDHLPYLQRRFETVQRNEAVGAIPYLPGSRVPYYQFVGRKPAT